VWQNTFRHGDLRLERRMQLAGVPGRALLQSALCKRGCSLRSRFL
jgi:hypothetical protein